MEKNFSKMVIITLNFQLSILNFQLSTFNSQPKNVQ